MYMITYHHTASHNRLDDYRCKFVTAPILSPRKLEPNEGPSAMRQLIMNNIIISILRNSFYVFIFIIISVIDIVNLPKHAANNIHIPGSEIYHSS
jgi:hypothetical protein